MRNNAYWPQRQKLISIPNNRSPSPYRVVRVSQSPNRQYFSPSPTKYIVGQISQSPQVQNHKVIKTVNKAQHPGYTVENSPSQTYYATNAIVVGNINGNAKQKKKQEAFEEYNVWEGYESKTDLMENTSRILLEKNSNQKSEENSALQKDFKKHQTPNPNYYTIKGSNENSRIVTQMQSNQFRTISPAKYRTGNQCGFLQYFR